MHLPPAYIMPETPTEQRHRLLWLADEATADLVIVIRLHLYHPNPTRPTECLTHAIDRSMATLTALRATLPLRGVIR